PNGLTWSNLRSSRSCRARTPQRPSYNRTDTLQDAPGRAFPPDPTPERQNANRPSGGYGRGLGWTQIIANASAIWFATRWCRQNAVSDQGGHGQVAVGAR